VLGTRQSHPDTHIYEEQLEKPPLGQNFVGESDFCAASVQWKWRAEQHSFEDSLTGRRSNQAELRPRVWDERYSENSSIYGLIEEFAYIARFAPAAPKSSGFRPIAHKPPIRCRCLLSVRSRLIILHEQANLVARSIDFGLVRGITLRSSGLRAYGAAQMSLGDFLDKRATDLTVSEVAEISTSPIVRSTSSRR
jgi:hypothetical protein